MGKAWEITAEDIGRWADRFEAAADLPRLVRRLLAATAPNALVEMPGGASTRLGGWDGLVQASEDSAFCPQGTSVWELSVEKKIWAKLNKDLKKRVEAPPTPVDPKRTTYIAVVARRLGSEAKHAWMQEKKALRAFADVRLYDAEDLVHWIERAPAVGRWFAALLGLPAEEGVDVEAFLEAWSRRTDPPLPWDLVLAGKAREEQAGEVRRWLTAPPGRPLPVRAETREEALLFMAAALARAPEADRWLARAIIVESMEAFRRALGAQRAEPLIVLPAFEGADPGQAARSEAYVVLPLNGRAQVEPGEALVLEALPYKALEKKLVAAGRREEEAERLVRDAGGKLGALQRLCGYIELPEWAQGSPRAELFALLLAGSWTPKNEADREIIQRLGADPDAALALCSELKKSGGAMDLVQEHWKPDVWRWSAPTDAWKALAGGLTGTHLTRFGEVVLEVLGAPDPVYGMPKEERFYAAVKGQVLRHSAALREGLAVSMVMLAQSDEVLRATSGLKRGSLFVGGLVSRLLDVERGWQAWASLSGLLPTLAEAAPMDFLSALEASLDQGEEGVAHLFAEEARIGLGPTPHTGLLWALEALGWSPDPLMLRRVALALARLAVSDREGHLPGKMMNRPINSLSDLLSFWMPQSNTSVEERLAVFTQVFDRSPDVGWKLALRWMGELSGMAMMTPAYRPRHLKWKLPSEHADVSEKDVRTQIEGVVSLVLERIGGDATSWAALLEPARHLPEDLESKVLDALQASHDQLDDVQALVWAALRKRIGLEHLGSDPEGAERRARLESLYNAFTPADLIARIAWLFGPDPTLPDPVEGNFDLHKKQSALQRLREAATLELWQQPNPWEALAVLIRAVQLPGELGLALGQAPFASEIEERLFGGAAEQGYSAILRGFARACYAKHGLPWIAGTIRKLRDLERIEDAATVAQAADQTMELWALLDATGDPVHARYWEVVPRIFGERPREEAEYAIEHLLAAGREDVALQTASRNGVSTTSALRVLERLRDRMQAAQDPEAALQLAKSISDYQIERVFDVLDTDPAIEPERALRLELSFLPWLKRTKRSVRYISRTLGENPRLFVDLIRSTYRPRGEKPPAEGISEEERRAAESASHILSAWAGYPGEGLPDGEREDRLEAWAAEVLDRTREDGRAEVGSTHVAEVLARAPKGADGIWPCLAARRLLEKGTYSHLSDRLQLAKRNARGMTRRALDEGGAQERELAAEYRASAAKLQDEFPRTATMLDELARRYEREAEEHEPKARRHRLEYGEDKPEPPPARAPTSPDAPGGPLTHLAIKGLGLAPSLPLDLAPRLNVLTGDNSLGKTLVLDVAWWALTGTWARLPAKPPRRGKTNGQRARPSASLSASAGERRMTAVYDAVHERWTGGQPLAHSLVLYARVDGGFSIWDPIRNAAPVDKDELDLSAGYHFTPEDLWNGVFVPGTRTPLCNGLINDAVRWRSERREAFSMLEKALAALSPPGELPITFGVPRPFRVKEARDYPTLLLPYGEDFAVHASASVKRNLGLAYALVWGVSEVQRAATVTEQAPIPQVTFLIDEIEAHLHPKWQRTIMRALLSVVEQLGLTASVQILATTHAPLVLASLEPLFKPATDALFDFDLVTAPSGGKRVEVEKEPWRLHGDVNAWLTSEIFGLKSTYSPEAEALIERAKKAVDDPKTDREKARRIHRKLRKVLSDLDPFWIRWRFIAEQRGWLE